MTPQPANHQDAELFRRLVESVADYAIFMLQPDGRVATWNIGAERIKGYRAEEIIGKPFSLFYLRDEVNAGKCEYELEVAERDGRFEDEGWRVRKDGTQFWANVIITAVRDDAGHLLGFAKVTRDLTERKRAEEAHAARLAAEHANRLKDEFLAILGHELRNPLAPIVTALQLIRLQDRNLASHELEIVERQVRHMMRLIDDLLDISRITRGTIQMKKCHTDLREILIKALDLTSPILEQREHHLEVDVPNAPIVVDADEDRMTQVFANLLMNAAKYTNRGGNICVSVSADNDTVTVDIRDDGAGIESTLLPKVFDLFVQGHRNIDRSNGGLGVGLTLVQMLVSLHGGAVVAQSAGPGLGSTFTVRLPRIDVPAVVAPAKKRNALPMASKARRVLIVDDNRDAVDLLAEILTSIGHEVQSALDAASALEIVKNFKPEVGILDIGLPVMDGYMLASRLNTELSPDLPHLIALTGYGQQNDLERSSQAGFHEHFIKPVEMQVLIKAIDSLNA